MSPVKLWYLSTRLYAGGHELPAKLIKLLIYLVYHAVLPYQAVIEPDVHLEHYGLGVVVHPNVTLGHGVRIYQHATIATRTWVGSPARIVIEDNVLIGAGAVIISRPDTSMIIGAGASIGANAVVTKDVLPGAVMVGVAATPRSTSNG